MVTFVATVTGDVVIVKSAVKLFAGAVAVAGTLAIDGLLLESEITAPPSGAPVLRTAVPLEGVPPCTGFGFASMLASAAGGGAGCGEKLRTAENGPGTPAALITRTRQKWVVVARPVVAYMVSVVVRSRTSGAVNPPESALWISYDTAVGAPFQSNVIGCGGVSALAGETRVTVPGVAGGATCAFVVEFTLIFVTKASPQKIDRSPFQMVSNAPVVAGKSRERVWPVRYTWPVPSRAMSSPTSVGAPPRKVEYSSAEPAAFNSETKASTPPLFVRSKASAVVGKPAEAVPASQAFPEASGATPAAPSPLPPNRAE